MEPFAERRPPSVPTSYRPDRDSPVAVGASPCPAPPLPVPPCPAPPLPAPRAGPSACPAAGAGTR
ncbi:hypothetical protein EF907_11835 [Streptomyces sp. WAC06273]|nr:hypothetical protein EF907_11835 [Streptomyces sp. WAC06273]